MKILNCIICTSEFQRWPSEIKNGRNKFCSIKCKAIQMSKDKKGENNPMWRGGKILLNCIVCNNEFRVKRHLENIAKFCSSQCHRKWQRETMRRENHWNWKGGIDSESHRLRNSFEYKLWRKSVFERDNYTCIWCGANKSETLNADHIKPFSLFPELRFAIDNGRTLCVDCHKTTDSYLNPYIKKENYQ